jgi:glycosyltransferase involved in cell wall biosynthesis
LSVASVCYALDRAAAKRVECGGIDAVYAYEDGALETFRAARRQGMKTVYELPIAHWKYKHELMAEEAELCPGWADTMGCVQDSEEKTDRKDAELELADLILVPCHYMIETLPESIRHGTRVQVCPYGTPLVVKRDRAERHSKLRVLYVGSLTQRKGVAYLLRALRQVDSLVEVTLIGSRVGTCAELDGALARYRYIPTLPHSQVLAEMEKHDVLVFPSLTEGYGLVILEALSRGLPVITTRNTGGPEVIRDGREGYFVPIRSADAIAEKLAQLAGDHDLLEAMSEAALERAQECTWQKYRELLASIMGQVMKPVEDSSGA